MWSGGARVGATMTSLCETGFHPSPGTSFSTLTPSPRVVASTGKAMVMRKPPFAALPSSATTCVTVPASVVRLVRLASNLTSRTSGPTSPWASPYGV
ncbi:hypothetical protein [Thermoanaerobaculum aquaticum]|uniref:hypothetical protein n=1 Tax=Thermoanaerobaculum aquaticum TaxID=1312852 RepID=UPI001376E0F8|nr:hypothetical protein [Thermoanaerobaculum aquaticum]